MLARGTAAIAGIASAAAALYILLADAYHGLTPWTMEHRLMPVLVVVTILTGHLAGAALRSWRTWPRAFGFALVFMAGTALTVLTSVGRQTASSDARHQDAEAAKAERLRLDTALRRYEGLHAETLTQMQKSCPSISTAGCDRIKALADTYAGLVRGAKAELKSAGFGPQEDGGAARVAEVIRLLGGSAGNTQQVLETLRPFMWSLFFEMTAILSFGFVFHVGPTNVGPSSGPRPNVGPTNVGQPNPRPNRTILLDGGLRDGPAQPPAQGPTLVQPISPTQVIDMRWAKLKTLAVDGWVKQSQTDLAKCLGFTTRKAAREWLRQLEKEGRIQLQTSKSGTEIKINSVANQKIILD
jgi:hypothetical protein